VGGEELSQFTFVPLRGQKKFLLQALDEVKAAQRATLQPLAARAPHQQPKEQKREMGG
jgi:hypothetical protein